MTAEGAVARPVRALSGGVGLAQVVTFAILAPFFWWTMHFLLAGRVRWRRLLPSAIATGLFFAGLGIFSKFYFSSTIIHDHRTYGSIGAIFGILTWFVAIGAVVILGAVAGSVWSDRSASRFAGTTGLAPAVAHTLTVPSNFSPGLPLLQPRNRQCVGTNPSARSAPAERRRGPRTRERRSRMTASS
jgi:uncharacterized membrane protein SirB2